MKRQYFIRWYCPLKKVLTENDHIIKKRKFSSNDFPDFKWVNRNSTPINEFVIFSNEEKEVFNIFETTRKYIYYPFFNDEPISLNMMSVFPEMNVPLGTIKSIEKDLKFLKEIETLWNNKSIQEAEQKILDLVQHINPKITTLTLDLEKMASVKKLKKQLEIQLSYFTVKGKFTRRSDIEAFHSLMFIQFSASGKYLAGGFLYHSVGFTETTGLFFGLSQCVELFLPSIPNQKTSLLDLKNLLVETHNDVTDRLKLDKILYFDDSFGIPSNISEIKKMEKLHSRRSLQI